MQQKLERTYHPKKFHSWSRMSRNKRGFGRIVTNFIKGTFDGKRDHTPVLKIDCP